MAVKTTKTAAEEQLPTREEAEAAFALAIDARQNRVRAALDKLAADPPQVLILEGGSVEERFSVALWHAARLNCPEAQPPCLHCPSCLQIGASLFQDLYILDGREGSIKIETVRELRTILGEAPRGDGKRVVILAEAQSLGVEAANALLKSLEEPRPGVCFLLLAPQRERLLPTLVSRGWVVTLAWPEADAPSTPELRQWEDALADFIGSGQGWFDRTSGKGAADRPFRPEGAGRRPRPPQRRLPRRTPRRPSRRRAPPRQRSAGAVPGIAGLHGQPAAGAQLAGHAPPPRLPPCPPARGARNRLAYGTAYPRLSRRHTKPAVTT